MVSDSAATFTGDLGLFAERAAALGVAVQRVVGSRDAADAVGAAANGESSARVLIAAELTDAAPDLVAGLNERRIDWAHPGNPDAINDQPFGISLARIAIAETGSVLLAESSLPDRGIGLLVKTQFVICPTNALRPTLDDASPILRELALRPGGAYSTLVTGPSRTADIERALTVGVQGPAKVIVLFVDNLT